MFSSVVGLMKQLTNEAGSILDELDRILEDDDQTDSIYNQRIKKIAKVKVVQDVIASKRWFVYTHNGSPCEEGSVDETKRLEQEEQCKKQVVAITQERAFFTFSESVADYLPMFTSNSTFYSGFMLASLNDGESGASLNKLRFELVPKVLNEDRFWTCFFFHVDQARRDVGMEPILSLKHRFETELSKSISSSPSPSTSPIPPTPSSSSLPATETLQKASEKEGQDEEVEYVPGLFGFTTVQQLKQRKTKPTLDIKQPLTHLAVVQKKNAFSSTKPRLAPTAVQVRAIHSIDKKGPPSDKRPNSGSTHTSQRSEQLDRKRRRHTKRVHTDSGSDGFVVLSGGHACGSESESGFSSPWETLPASCR